MMMTMTSIMSPRISLLSAVLLLGTANAQFTETKLYSDVDCADWAYTWVADGALGASGGLEAFGVCNNLTGSSDDYSSSMYECADNEVTVSYYADSSCTGTTVWTNQTTSNTCNFGQVSRCTEDSEWSVVTDWVVNVTFYSDVNCSIATGVTTLYTMAEAQDLAGDACAPEESTTNESSTFNEATGCVDGEVHTFLYAESDTTCSSEFVLIFMEATDSCMLSFADDGPYMSTACSVSDDDSDDDSDEDSPESDGAPSLVTVGGGSCGWSIVATAIAIALVTAFG